MTSASTVLTVSAELHASSMPALGSVAVIGISTPFAAKVDPVADAVSAPGGGVACP